MYKKHSIIINIIIFFADNYYFVPLHDKTFKYVRIINIINLNQKLQTYIMEGKHDEVQLNKFSN